VTGCGSPLDAGVGATHQVQVLREDDPRAAALLALGWRVAHRSWGARLHDPVLGPLADLVAAAEARGYHVAEARAEADPAIAALEAAVREDCPGGPVTAPGVHDPAALAALRAGGSRFFAAFSGDEPVAVTAIRRDPERAETDFTSVARGHRRRGLAEAVKAASVLALAAEGAAVFGTGDAEENAASSAMNARLGYAGTERWLTLTPPPR
jgi:hypothetical protein